jgi:hypothetical protein
VASDGYHARDRTHHHGQRQHGAADIDAEIHRQVRRLVGESIQLPARRHLRQISKHGQHHGLAQHDPKRIAIGVAHGLEGRVLALLEAFFRQHFHVVREHRSQAIAYGGGIGTGFELNDPDLDEPFLARREQAQKVQVAGDQRTVDAERGPKVEEADHGHLAILHLADCVGFR